MSWRVVTAMAAILAGLLIFLNWHSNRPEYDPEQLTELRQIFEQQTKPLRRGQLGYDLPKPDVARRELAYLADLATLLEKAQPADCLATEEALLERHAAYLEGAHASIFKQAYQIWAKGQGQDFVHNLSNEISFGRGFRSRSATPTDWDQKLALLKEKTDRVELVDAGLAILDRLARAADAFGQACPLESGALHTALGTFGN